MAPPNSPGRVAQIKKPPWSSTGAVFLYLPVEWIIKNQFGRRNLSLMDRSRLALRLEDVYRERAKANQREHGGTAPGKTLHQKSDKVSTPVNTLKEIAKVAGVSHDTIHKAKVIEQKATPEQKADLSVFR